MTMLPSTHRPAMRTTVPATAIALPLGTCNGTGAVAFPSEDGPVKFACDGCTNCMPCPVAPILTPLGEEFAARRRAARTAQAFAATSDDEAF